MNFFLDLISPEFLLLLTGAILPFLVQIGKWIVTKTGVTLTGKSVRVTTFITCVAVTSALYIYTGQALPTLGGFSGELSNDAFVVLNFLSQYIVVFGVVFKVATLFYDKALVQVFDKLGWK